MPPVSPERIIATYSGPKTFGMALERVRERQAGLDVLAHGDQAPRAACRTPVWSSRT